MAQLQVGRDIRGEAELEIMVQGLNRFVIDAFETSCSRKRVSLSRDGEEESSQNEITGSKTHRPAEINWGLAELQ